MRAKLRPLIWLSVPPMVRRATTRLIGVIDRVMISPLGKAPLAATAITSAVVIILVTAL